MSQMKNLGTERISRLLLKFSLPSIIGMLVNALYNVVDRIYVGQGVGTVAMSAIAVIFPVFLIIFGLINLVGMGGAALISLFMGEKKNEEAEKVIGTGVILMILASLLVVIPGELFTVQILKVAGIAPEALAMGVAYLRTVLIFTPFQFIAWGLNSFIRSTGNPMRTMYSMLVGALVNIILDPLFIFVFKMGIVGAAIATGISYIVTAVWNFLYFADQKKPFALRLRDIRFNGKLIWGIVKIGMPMFMTQSVICLFNFVLNHQILRYGGEQRVLAQAALAVVYGFNMLFFMPLLGINMGLQPIIGYNYGARQFKRVRKALGLAILSGVVLTSLCALVTLIFPGPIFQLFNRTDTELARFGVGIMRTVMMTFPLVGFIVLGSGYYQSVGRPVEAFILSIFRPVLVMIPLLFLLPRFMGLSGIFWAMPIADILTALAVGLFMLAENRKIFAAGDELPETEAA